MTSEKFRVSEFLQAEGTDEGLTIKAREEVGRGKRFGMDGEIEMSTDEALTLAKWIFARDLGETPK